MMSLRILIVALAGASLAACNTVPAPFSSVGHSTGLLASYAGYQAGQPHEALNEIALQRPELARQTVSYEGAEAPGTIVVKTSERRLYLVLPDGKAVRYPVGVGRAGKQWQGQSEVDGAYVEPAWAPTAEIKRDNPSVPDLIPGGSSHNPMGARALTLTGGEYAIHGTNRPQSVGTYASYGCIRMFNEDIVDLFGRVRVGTQVVVSL
jgi:lipoprotein-anchoring transpeptidase ErfK/SrfK